MKVVSYPRRPGRQQKPADKQNISYKARVGGAEKGEEVVWQREITA